MYRVGDALRHVTVCLTHMVLNVVCVTVDSEDVGMVLFEHASTPNRHSSRQLCVYLLVPHTRQPIECSARG